MSRFARNREDSIGYKFLLGRHGIQAVFMNEPIDNSATGQMMEGIIEALDEFYPRNLAQVNAVITRSKAVFEHLCYTGDSFIRRPVICGWSD